MTNHAITTGIKQQDASVYAYLYQTLGGKVKGYVLKNSGTREDAEDVLQQVFLELPTAILGYKEEHKFLSWFFTIVGNTWAQVLRKRKTRTFTSTDELFYLEDNSAESIEHNIVKERKYEILYKELKTLPEECETLLRLFYIEDLGSKVLAERYKIEDNAMRVRIKRCRDKLVKKIENVVD
jgi:RNA polymerase sigma-70 factor (ECF subfamily)